MGVSYGTFIGAMYAELFPERTGHLVLDSAMDITNEGEVSQAEGFELALGLYADWCAGEGSCSLGNSRDEVISRINSFLHGLDAKPLKVGDRQMTQGQGANGNNKIDLICMFPNGRKGIAHFFNGSISSDLVNHSNTPVLTIKLEKDK